MMRHDAEEAAALVDRMLAKLAATVPSKGAPARMRARRSATPGRTLSSCALLMLWARR